jgi:hypothetical protein
VPHRSGSLTGRENAPFTGGREQGKGSSSRKSPIDLAHYQAKRMPPSLELEIKAKISLPRKNPLDLAHTDRQREFPTPSLEVEGKAKVSLPRKSPIDLAH